MGTKIGMGIAKGADKKEDKIKALSATIEEKNKEIDTLSKTIQEKDKEIESLKSSEGGTEDGTNTENGNGSAGKSNTKKTK